MRIEDVGESQEELQEEYIYSDDEELKKEPTGLAFDKNELIDKELIVEVTGLIKNQWGKPELLCNIEGEDSRLRLSKTNKNTLIDLLGTKLSEWKGKKVKVAGKLWTGDINGVASSGVELLFYK